MAVFGSILLTGDMSAVYNDGYFHAKGIRLYFTTIGEKRYFVANIGDRLDIVYEQKLEPVAQPTQIQAAIDGRVWLRRNVKAYEGSMIVPSHIVISHKMDAVEGYVDFGGVKKITSPTTAGMAVDALRDLTELIITETDSGTWAWITGLIYTSADKAKVLASGETKVTVGREGYSEWLRVADDSILSFQMPQKGRIILFDPAGSAVYDSAVDSGPVFAPAGSFVESAGNAGDSFTVQASATP